MSEAYEELVDFINRNAEEGERERLTKLVKDLKLELEDWKEDRHTLARLIGIRK